MKMIDPPIDELKRRTNGNGYILANLISKRAKEIDTCRRVEMDEMNTKPIDIACEEVFQKKVIASNC